MRAWQIRDFDSPPAFVEMPVPAPDRGQLRLRITACGLNFADLLLAKGTYQDTPTPPFTPGLECCGVVDALGPDTKGPAVGTRVMLVAEHGGLAEYGVFPADHCLPVADTMPDTVAAGFQIAYGTSHLVLDRRARLQPGETLVVLGAAGGVGLTAVEIGRAMGARVIAVARGAEKCAIARAAGAEVTLDAGCDLKAELKALGGADVIYDPVGGDGWRAALSALRPEGRYVVIGFASGDVPQIPANLLLVKNIDVIGFYWGGYRRFAPRALADSMAVLTRWHADGRLSPHISHTLPLERATEGFELLRSRSATGKVVITPGT